mmetsp:Transcript_11823/g.34113  ORF Transcript_11823/g.34113 Transcript_11823/m.34113 type:complete len:330 (-) Transcript_11823:1863-2852(-)
MATAKPYFASVNGEPVESPTVSTWDVSFQRGLGIFEVIRILPNGKLRAPDLHWDRMLSSADAIDAKDALPPKHKMMEWMATAAESQGEGYIRIIVTLGAEDANNEALSTLAPPNVYIMWHPMPKWPSAFSLKPLYAPWHTAGKGNWNNNQPAPKVTSYGPNVLSSRSAKRDGFTDALLLTDAAPSHSSVREAMDLAEMFVLDGPNFAVGWIGSSGKSNKEGSAPCIYFPSSSELGLLKSTTQQLIMTIVKQEYPEWTIEEGIYRLQDMLDVADEPFVMSSTRGIIPVTTIGDVGRFELGPFVPKLQRSLQEYTKQLSSAAAALEQSTNE